MAKIPSTPALRWLRAQRVSHDVHVYTYIEKGGTRASATAFGVDEHVIIKTLIFEDHEKRPLIVLMHGDRQVSTKALARVMGVRFVQACTPATAQKHSGYQVGGTSPFATKKSMPVYVQPGVTAVPKVYVNAGARGVLVSLDPSVFVDALGAVAVDVAR
jgi:Cys-tRNA(Pro) deacylase